MRNIFFILSLIAIAFLFNNQLYAQGCVAIRSTGGLCTMGEHPEHSDNSSHWIFSTNARYFKSFRHFRGTEEQKERLSQGTEVINHQFALDLAMTRVFNNRWSLLIDVPVNANSRSSLYEHGLVNGVYLKKERHTMHSFGLGDMRIAAYRWLLNPEKNMRGNIQAGLGIKLPTGDYNYKDYWYNVGTDGGKELRPVDQSIQLGDGGTGITAELNAFYNFKTNFGLYGNFYYLSNPREQNGVRTYRETLSPALANEAIMSVPDQYMARGGVTYAPASIKGLTAAAGIRLEGIPVYDLIGGSGDFRRPGYVWSVEPGLTYRGKKVSVYTSVPFAIDRNRTQSVTDKENSRKTGKYVQGDAAFADYSINLGFAVRL